MVRPAIRALLALLSGVAVASAAPATAVVHGHAHAELLEHANAHHDVPHGADIATLDVDSEHDGHGHPVLDPGWFSRLGVDMPALAATPMHWDLASPGAGTSAPAPTPFETPPRRLRTRPALPRAPPVL